MEFSLKILDDNNSIKLQILNELKDLINKALIKSINKIEPKSRILLRQALRNEPEYYSLINGDLRKEFGIQDTSNVDIAIDNMVNSMNITIDKASLRGSSISGGLILTVIPKNLTSIIDDSSAFVVDADRGYSLPWLEWLLVRGGEIIVRNFEVKYTRSSRSRSGEAIMISSGKNWRVPSEFAGTINNNWITRALSRIEDKLVSLLRSEFEASI